MRFSCTFRPLVLQSQGMMIITIHRLENLQITDHRDLNLCFTHHRTGPVPLSQITELFFFFFFFFFFTNHRLLKRQITRHRKGSCPPLTLIHVDVSVVANRVHSYFRSH